MYPLILVVVEKSDWAVLERSARVETEALDQSCGSRGKKVQDMAIRVQDKSDRVATDRATEFRKLLAIEGTDLIAFCPNS